jgi:two-component system response regulator
MPASTVATRRVRYVPEPIEDTLTSGVRVPSRYGTPGEPFEVLLVEDDDDEIVLVEHTLKRAGLTDRPHVVRDGRAALDVLLGPSRYAPFRSPLADAPDVILLDLALPKISGINVLQRIKSNARISDIPVVVLSGNGDEVMAQVCMDLGASMYIIKPISEVHVMNVIVAIQRHWLASENFRRWTIERSERRAA